METIKTIGVFTSGGDAPGMNACIRAVVRTALNNGIKVKGILRGYNGLIEDEFIDMNKQSVSNIINRGGTILYTARSKEFMTLEGQKKGYANYKKHKLDAIVALGGDGTYRGALALSKLGANVIGVPCTIDLDIVSTDYTIGFDTAINTAMDGIDKIRDTSTSHERCSIIEVMGRNAGYIAIYTGLATGAEEMIIPENLKELNINAIATRIKLARKKGKKHYIIINAEGIGHSYELAKEIEKATGIETRATVLGYLQRGGEPSCRDRVVAALMGYKAVETLINGEKNKLITYKNGKIDNIDITKGLKLQKSISNIFFDTIIGVDSK